MAIYLQKKAKYSLLLTNGSRINQVMHNFVNKKNAREPRIYNMSENGRKFYIQLKITEKSNPLQPKNWEMTLALPISIKIYAGKLGTENQSQYKPVHMEILECFLALCIDYYKRTSVFFVDIIVVF